MSTTRDRKEQFIREFGDRAVRAAFERMIARHGLALFSDQQLDEVLADMVQEWRFTARLHRSNRAVARTRAGLQ